VTALILTGSEELRGPSSPRSVKADEMGRSGEAVRGHAVAAFSSAGVPRTVDRAAARQPKR
jgi:hypothetical protein